MNEKIKYDLIGGIYDSDIMQMMDMHRVESLEEKIAWHNLIEALSKEIGRKKAEEIGELVNSYANASGETTFRCGFHIAMRICMEGLHGGIK